MFRNRKVKCTEIVLVTVILRKSSTNKKGNKKNNAATVKNLIGL